MVMLYKAYAEFSKYGEQNIANVVAISLRKKYPEKRIAIQFRGICLTFR